MRAIVANIVAEKLQSLQLKFPTVTANDQEDMLAAKKILQNE